MEKNRILLLTIILLVLLGSVGILCMYISTQSEIPDLPNTTEVTSERLLNAAVLGGNYLINVTNTDGSFIYNYNASSNTKSTSYNILRHAGTTYAMLQLYDVTKDQKLLQAAQKTIDFLVQNIKPFQNMSCIVYDDEIKLGGNALAIIALAEYTQVTKDTSYVSTMQDLAKYIEYSQKPNGEFISKRYYSTGEIDDFVSEYYPGEALLSLIRLHAIDADETWINITENGAQYLITIRDGNLDTNNLIHDHWLLMALNELYRIRPQVLYFNQSMRIAESIMFKQRDNITRIPEYPEWLGSYYTPPRSTPTATRSEGLIAAFQLSNDFGEENMTSKIFQAITRGITFQLGTQLNSEDVADFPNPGKALGGFTEDLVSSEIRIDYVQHNICSILGLYTIQIAEG